VKIAKRSENFVREGDTITVAVTHEIKIGGESSWVRYETTTKVTQETSEEASERAIGFVNQGAIKAVHDTVAKVRGAVE